MSLVVVGDVGFALGVGTNALGGALAFEIGEIEVHERYSLVDEVIKEETNGKEYGDDGLVGENHLDHTEDDYEEND